MEEEEIKKEEEDKVLYKGQEITPEEFVRNFEKDTKKKERNAESIARKKLQEKQEEEIRRKAFVEAIIPSEEDKRPDDYGPGYGEKQEEMDMSMYQLDLPFDVQQGPNMQLGPIGAPQQEYRLGGLYDLIDDNRIKAFKEGGIKKYLGGGKKQEVDASIYNNPQRKNIKYRKVDGKWQIMGEHTAYNWTDVKTKDPKNYEKRIKAIEYGKQKDMSKDPEDLVPREILIRQAYKESRFKADAINDKNKNKSKDYGLTQINEKGALADYNKKFPNSTIKKEDLKNPEIAKRVQKWYMNNIYDKEFINKGAIQSKESRIAKTVASYNMGPGAILKALDIEKAKFKGSDKNNPIYKNYDWLKNKELKNPNYVREIMGKDKTFNSDYKRDVKKQTFYKDGGVFSKLIDDENISNYKKSKKK